MARLPRIVLPGIPHHITQRGNRRQRVFFEDDDFALYLDLVSTAARASGTAIWAYCLMPNHVHLIAVPGDIDGLRATFGEAHRRYTAHVNARARWTGHLWQGRYGSVAMDDAHLVNAVRYITMNPVVAGLAEHPMHWRWSSAAAHYTGVDSDVVAVAPVIERTGDFRVFMEGDADPEALFAPIEKATASGRPIGDTAWIAAMEARYGLTLAPGKRGPRG